MPDVAGVLRDEQEMSLSSQGPVGSGVGLGDGAGQGLVISVYDKPPPFDVVLELLDRGGYGQELPVEGGVPGLRVGESTAEGERLEPPSMVLMEDTADGGVGGFSGDGHRDVSAGVNEHGGI